MTAETLDSPVTPVPQTPKFVGYIRATLWALWGVALVNMGIILYQSFRLSLEFQKFLERRMPGPFWTRELSAKVALAMTILAAVCLGLRVAAQLARSPKGVLIAGALGMIVSAQSDAIAPLLFSKSFTLNTWFAALGVLLLLFYFPGFLRVEHATSAPSPR